MIKSIDFLPCIVGSWIADRDIANNWIRAEFITSKYVFESTTRGRGNYNQYIKSYTLSYGSNVTYLQYVFEGGNVKEFEGNIDTTTKVSHEIDIYARYVQLNIVEYRSHPSLRWGLTGCC